MDVNVAVLLLLVLLGAGAAFLRRFWAVLLPLFAMPLFYAGLRLGWWGDGVGDGWQYAAALVTLAGFLSCAVGVVVGRLLAGLLRH